MLLRPEAAHEILRDLMTGASELAVTSVRPPGAFGWIELQQKRLMLIVPSTHRPRNRRRVGLHELAGRSS